jgi:ribosomal protein L35AE/L33A
MILRLAFLALLIALAAPLASATVGPDAPQAATISIGDVTVTEGDTGATTASFTVTLSELSTNTVTVDYATADGSAAAPGDYSAVSGTLTFLPDETTQTVSADVNGDTLDEDDETFTVELSNPANATIDDGEGVGTITDDDPVPAVSIGNATVTEGNTGTVMATFTATLDAPSGRTVTVDYATSDGTATAPADYLAAGGTVTFLPNQTSQPVSVTVNGDTLDEANETYLVTLSNATNATILDSQGLGTITDDDTPPTVSVDNVTVTEGNSGNVNATFDVSLSTASGQAASVNYAAADGTATAPTDYAATSGTVHFAAGETTKQVTVIVHGDTLDETNETFTLNLSNATNATIADGTGVGTITDDDIPPALSVNNVTVTEGNSGTVTATFNVSLDAPSGQTVNVDYATADGTATAPADYTATSDALTFTPGQMLEQVNVTVNGDLIDELDETFTLNLSNASNATIADGTGVGTITDDDGPPSLSVNNVTVTEGNSGTMNATFTVTMSAASGQTVTVQYASADGTATAPADYTSTSGTLTFTPGQTTKQVSVPVVGDTLDEADETFTLGLTNAANATIADPLGLGTITDDDPQPGLSVNNVTVTEGDAGNVNATFTVSLAQASGRAVSVQYATADDTATAPADYAAASGTLNFPAGQTTQQVTVLVHGDTLDEANETYTLNLSNAVNAAVADGTGTGTITDDDPLPALAINDVSVAEGDTGTVAATFTVTLSAVSGRNVTVGFATVNNTAVAPGDYTAASGTLTFTPGQTSKTVTVQVNGDLIAEIDETFFVDISGATNATIGDSRGVGTIIDDDAQPTLSIGDVTVTESDTGMVNANFTVSLSSASGQTVSVGYSTEDGTATAPADYTATGGSLVFTPGQVTKTVTVRVKGDTLDEIDETFTVNLADAVNAVIANGTGVGTITDDDPPPTVSVNNATVTEGDTGTINANFTVTLSAASGKTITIDYATVDGTATAPADYVAGSGTLTFTPGQTTKTVTVPVNGDLLDEANETFIVTLSNPSNVTIADGQGVGTINDNDPTPAVSVNDVTVTEGNGGTVNATFTLSLNLPSGRDVSVDYATADGTAQAPADYQATSGTATFTAGQTSQQVTVLVNGDLLDETNETFTLNLTNAVNVTIPDAQATGTITDDDPMPSLSVNDVSVVEGDLGTTNATFSVSLSAPSGRAVTVDYATADGTAQAPLDYLATNGTLNFAPGQTSKTVTVLVNGDLLDEGSESFFLNLTNPGNATISDGQGLGTITNDDGAPGLSVNDVTVTEGDSGTTNATFTVTLAPASGQNVSVAYATADGTATAPADYAATSGTLTFSPGQTTKTVTVQVVGDTLDELDETYTLNLSNAVNAAILDPTGLGTIVDNDPSPALAINDATVTEPDTGSVNATFTVSLTAASSRSITVDYATANGTATAPADYTAGSGTLTFTPGQTSKTMTVPVLGDLLDEANETFFVNLTNPSNATIVDGQGLGTITDNDPLPSLSINDVTVTEGNVGTVFANFTVTLNAASGRPVSVDFATADITATVGADYLATSGTVTFAAGETTRQVTAIVNGDFLDEANETFALNLTNQSNATIVDAQGVGTITDDDALPALSVNDVTVTEGNSGTVAATFTVTLTPVSGRSVTVDYATADGTAQAPGDYQATNGTLTFTAGQTTRTVTVLVNGDVVDENNETFFLNLTNPGNATISDAQGVGTITDNDGAPTLSINDATVTEGNTGTTNAVFTVTLSSASGVSVTVAYATANGTATAPADYTATTGTLTFPAGVTTRTITVPVVGDVLDEANETYTVNLSNATNASISDGQGLGTITDDDAAPTLSINNVTVTEGDTGTLNANFTVTMSAVSGQNVSVDFATADSTATAPADYTATNGTLTFTPGQTTKQVTVQVNGDLLDEANETYFVNLTNASNATISDPQGLGTITDNDPLPALSINDITVTEGNSGQVAATFTVTLAPVSGRSVSVSYATADGTAQAPGDYQAGSGTLTFTAGQTMKQVTVLVNGDLLDEADETFLVNLTGPTNATLADAQGVGTITDDDALPSLVVDDVTVTEGDSGTTNANFTVTLSAASGQTVTVQYATADGTAHAPGDYEAGSGTVTFAAGQTTRTVTVHVNGDLLNENNETYSLNLSGPTNATIGDGQGIGTIVDDDGLPSLSINDVTVTEGDSGTTNANFTVTLSVLSAQSVSVGFATADGSAHAPDDYFSGGGNLVFSPGQTTKAVTVQARGDLLDEPDENYFVNLSGAVNATIDDGEGEGMITDDDAPPALSVNDVTVTEGDSGTVNANFTVNLDAPSGREVTVDFFTSDGTAHAPDDYQSGSGTVTFAASQTSKTVTVLVNGDTLFEPGETYFVNLSNPVNALLADGQGLGTIMNDDAPPLPPPPPPLPPPPPPPPPLPPPPPSRPPAHHPPLYQPPSGARLTVPPVLKWRGVKRARFYNLQLYRKGRKLLSIWPARTSLKLHKRWTYQGRSFRMTRGAYTWIVWPAYGSRTQPRYGSMVGQSTFKIAPKG